MNINRIIAERPWILAVGVALLVGLWLFSGTLTRKIDATDSIDEVTGVTPVNVLTRVQVRTQHAVLIARYISVYGRTAPARIVTLKAETDGRVVAIGVRRGEQIKNGALIARLDLRDRQARLGQAQAGVKEHQTAYDAQVKLKAEGYVSDTQLAETMARLEAARAELTRAELDLDHMYIRAPFDGALKERDVEVGDYVKSGDQVATFVDNTEIIVTGSIAEQDARFAQVGGKATAVLVTGQTISGHIRYVSPVADESTRTFLVELEVPNPDGALPSGVTAELKVNAGETLAQKVSPSYLSLEADGTVGIKAVDELGRVQFFPVEIAQSEPDGVWVTGLPETADVIIVGQGYVTDGQTVEAIVAESETALAAEQLR